MSAERCVWERVMGAPPPGFDVEQGVLDMRRKLSGNDAMTRADVRAELVGLMQGQYSPDGLSDAEIDTASDIVIAKTLLTHQGEMPANPLVDWPVYQGMLQARGQRARPGSRALMLGAMGPLTARTFEVMAQDLYGADQALVVDLSATPEKSLHGEFVQADAMRLPFASHSVGVIQTSILFPMLEDRASERMPFRPKVLRLFQEIGRVLEPGGQVFMIEAVPSIRGDDPVIKERE